MSLLTKDLSSELKLKAKEELGEDVETLDEDIQRLKENVLKVEGLNSRTDDAFLLRFLRNKKFNQSRALEMIKNYYKQRQKNPKIFGTLTAAENSNMLEGNSYTVIRTDLKGRPVLCSEASHWDPSKVTIDEVIAFQLLSLERLIQDQETQIKGVVSLANLKGLSINHVLAMTPFSLARMLSLIVNTFPVRLKQVHFVNESKIFDIIYAIVRPLLPKKIRDRIIFHGNDYKTLHEYISPDVLYEELGGNLGPFSNSEWVEELLAHDAVMISNKAYGYVTKN